MTTYKRFLKSIGFAFVILLSFLMVSKQNVMAEEINNSENVSSKTQQMMIPAKFVGQINYVPGYGVNLMASPNGSWTGQRLLHGSKWKVLGYTDVNNQRWYNLGLNQWIYGEYLKEASSQNSTPQKPTTNNTPNNKLNAIATITYMPGYGIAVFKGPSSSSGVTGNVLKTGTRWKVNAQESNNGITWYSVGKNQWIAGSNIVVSGLTYNGSARLNVPLIKQRPELPNGCEITAVTMMVNYAGNPVSKMKLAAEMPRHPSNPNLGYIGNPAGDGITIFPPALMKLVNKYTGNAKNLTGLNLDALYYQLDLGHPVVTWNTLHGFPYHALTVWGYDNNNIYYNDCWTGQKTQMTKSQFLANWNTQARRAISY